MGQEEEYEIGREDWGMGKGRGGKGRGGGGGEMEYEGGREGRGGGKGRGRAGVWREGEDWGERVKGERGDSLPDIIDTTSISRLFLWQGWSGSVDVFCVS